MIEIIIVGEGQTEETFVRDVLAPPFAAREIFLYPRLIHTSKSGRGGALSPERVLLALRNTLRERQDVYVSTFFDLYGLRQDFPGRAEAETYADPVVRAETIEQHFAAVVVEHAQCRADRFIPHIQPYEFEALLFSDPDALVEGDRSWRARVESLREARADGRTPEHINDGENTHPSARLESLLVPNFGKCCTGLLQPHESVWIVSAGNAATLGIG